MDNVNFMFRSKKNYMPTRLCYAFDTKINDNLILQKIHYYISYVESPKCR